jgi:hypothetical protein
MDYNFRGHPRIIFSKTLIGASKKTRIFATQYLRQLLRADVAEFSDWGVRFLYTQTYDPVIEICEKAVMTLEEACSNEVNLASLVKLRPSFDHLLDLGTPLVGHIYSKRFILFPHLFRTLYLYLLSQLHLFISLFKAGQVAFITSGIQISSGDWLC